MPGSYSVEMPVSGYVPTNLVPPIENWCACTANWRDEAARYKNEVQALLVVLFPEFSLVFADPCRSTAVALLKLYPSAQAMAKAGVETIAAKLHELAPRNYGRSTAGAVGQSGPALGQLWPGPLGSLHQPQDSLRSVGAYPNQPGSIGR